MSTQEQLRALAAEKEAEAGTWSIDPEYHEHYTADEMMAFSEACLNAERDLRCAAVYIDELESALDRLYRNTRSIMAGLAVRDLGETFAEVEAVLPSVRKAPR